MTGTTSHHLGVDLGATNLKWAVVERAGTGWSTIDRGRSPTRAVQGPEAVVQRLIEIGRGRLASWPALSTVGIGVPGLYDPVAGTTRFLVNVPGAWHERPVAAPVAEALGLACRLINDARAFGLAELRLGAGRGVASMVGLTLGTGVGGVIVIDGRVLQGHDGTAGEIGHQTIDPDGPLCGCGNQGCLEAFAKADRIAAVCGTRSAGEAVQAARRGDQSALDGLSEIGRYLGIGIANLVTLISPDRVVIGGGLAAAGELLLAPIREELRSRVLTTSLDRVELVTAELGTWAGAIGAAVHGAEAVPPRVAVHASETGPG